MDLRHGESGRGRYDCEAFGKTFSGLLTVLWQADLLDYKHSPRRGEKSSIAPSQWFIDKVKEAGITFADFGRDLRREVIVLSRNSFEETVAANGKLRRQKERIEYEDTHASRRYRAAVRRLNSFLERAEIAFAEDVLQPVVDPWSRSLTRHFALLRGQPEIPPRFDQVGRLSGGFWMTLPKERRAQISIAGEPVATLDYSSMFTRLAYVELRKRPPERDLYEVCGLHGYRSGVKLAMNCFLFDSGPRRNWPKKMGVGVGTDAEAPSDDPYEGRLPKGWGVGRTKKAILSEHPLLKDAWGRALGYRLMWRESEILMAVLADLMRRRITALGLHDGLLVAASQKAEALGVMREQSKKVTGVELPAFEKTD